MQYVSNTDEDKAEILRTIGVKSFEELLKDIPEELRLSKMNLPEGISEMQLLNELRKKGQKNMHGGRFASFLGAGLYDHYIPPLVNELASRGEFITAYTPYQGEASQGTLQTIYEFQSYICLLTGMEVANASMYDGASSLAEAALMVLRHTHRKTIVVSKSLHPESYQTLKTYLSNIDARIVVVPEKKGVTDLSALKKTVNQDAALIIAQSPNCLGAIEDLPAISKIAKDSGAKFAVSSNPLALSLLASPGEVGADIAVGEGQPLGNPIAYGGPHFGYFATTSEFMRKIPGRLSGITEDKDGKRAYVLTLQAREQHIRREKATSNICTNHALCALKASIFLATLGKTGFRRMGELNVERSHHAWEVLTKLKGVTTYSDASFFNEFALNIDAYPDQIEAACYSRKLIGPFDLARWSADWKGRFLFAVTEQRSDEDIDNLADALKEAIQKS